MSYLSKEIYERKAAYAVKRNRENMLIDTLTESQHYAIQEICSIRHDVHSMDCSKLINPESSDYDNWDYIDTCNIENKIIMLISDNNLPAWDWKYDYLNIYNLNDINDILDEDYSEDQEEEREEAFDKMFNDSTCEAAEIVEKWNRSIEEWLKVIDETFGTSYCPTGLSRIF